MNIKKFLNIDIEPTPPELQLSVEVRCREIMASNDIDNIKRYATHLVRHQARQDVFLASLLGFPFPVTRTTGRTFIDIGIGFWS